MLPLTTASLAVNTFSDRLLNPRGQIKTFLATRVANPADANDILQNHLPNALQLAADPGDETKLGCWFRQILLRAVVDYARSLEPAGLRERAWRLASSTPIAEYEQAIQQCIEALLDTLRPMHAAFLHLVELDGASIPSAAAALNLTARDANIVHYGARKELRARIEVFFEACAGSTRLD